MSLKDDTQQDILCLMTTGRIIDELEQRPKQEDIMNIYYILFLFYQEIYKEGYEKGYIGGQLDYELNYSVPYT